MKGVKLHFSGIRAQYGHFCMQYCVRQTFTFLVSLTANRGARRFFRRRRGPPRRPRPPPQDSQGEDRTEGTDGERWVREEDGNCMFVCDTTCSYVHILHIYHIGNQDPNPSVWFL